MQETWVRSLGQEDPLEKEMRTHSSILVSSSLPKHLGLGLPEHSTQAAWLHNSLYFQFCRLAVQDQGQASPETSP